MLKNILESGTTSYIAEVLDYYALQAGRDRGQTHLDLSKMIQNDNTLDDTQKQNFMTAIDNWINTVRQNAPYLGSENF